MKLKKIKPDHYVIVDDSEIKVGDWYLTFQNENIIGEPRKCEDSSYDFTHCKKITHSTQPLNTKFNDWFDAQIITLSEVKELIGEVDVEKKAEILYCFAFGGIGNLENSKKEHWIKGYNQALEDNKEKKYTEEDLSKAMRMYKGEFTRGIVYSQEQIIQSLQPKTEWEVEFDENGKLKLV